MSLYLLIITTMCSGPTVYEVFICCFDMINSKVHLPLTIDDRSEHGHTFEVWIAHGLIQNQTTDTEKTT